MQWKDDLDGTKIRKTSKKCPESFRHLSDFRAVWKWLNKVPQDSQVMIDNTGQSLFG